MRTYLNNYTATSNNLPRLSLLVDLAKTSPLSQLLVVVNLQKGPLFKSTMPRPPPSHNLIFYNIMIQISPQLVLHKLPRTKQVESHFVSSSV